ncbi:MAG: prepilin-type N-terminal cleavage/methylation domain-containing protein [Planctomycetes bacterium]|nr:prepilin-type N-terminal cleavage/methylation domain-containing protein [Planctomycetota bacterium]
MRGPRQQPAAGERGFTLIEILVVLALIGMLMAVVVPNLGILIPSARLRGTGTTLQRNLDLLRSEARIQSKRIAMEFDLDKRRWRAVYPPEQMLTRDQDTVTLEEKFDAWQELEDDVVFGGVDTGAQVFTRGPYRLVFDEFGFTNDQIVHLRLESDPTEAWSLTLMGLSGRTVVTETSDGNPPRLQMTNEGAF